MNPVAIHYSLFKILIRLVTKRKMRDVYRAMLQRCNNPNCESYRLYGALGISVCDRWNSFDNFLVDMASGYSFGLTLERKNSKGNYEPDNCCWANRFVQNNNTNRNVKFTINGATNSISQWAKIAGVTPQTMRWRLTHWPHAHILSKKSKNTINSEGRFQKRCFTITENVEPAIMIS